MKRFSTCAEAETVSAAGKGRSPFASNGQSFASSAVTIPCAASVEMILRTVVRLTPSPRSQVFSGREQLLRQRRDEIEGVIEGAFEYGVCLHLCASVRLLSYIQNNLTPAPVLLINT